MINDNLKLDVWGDAIENMERDQQRRVRKLADKYGWPLDGNNMEFKDSVEYDLIKPYLEELEEADKTYQVAENTGQANCSDATPQLSALKNYQAENDKLLREHVKWLRRNEVEGNIPYIYLDIKGNMTTGIGLNVDNYETFMNIGWQVDGRPATLKEKQVAYNRLTQLKKQGEFGQIYSAIKYKNETPLTISDEYAIQIAVNHLKGNVAYLQKNIPEFDTLPYPLKLVLLDICYNTGSLKKEKWPKLYKAISQKNLTGIAQNVRRRDVNEHRNKWAEELIKAIPEENGWTWKAWNNGK